MADIRTFVSTASSWLCGKAGIETMVNDPNLVGGTLVQSGWVAAAVAARHGVVAALPLERGAK
jgi:hypothetical protein